MNAHSLLVLLRHGARAHVRLVNIVVARGLDLRGIVYEVNDGTGLAVCVLDVAGDDDRLRRLPAQLERVVDVMAVHLAGSPPASASETPLAPTYRVFASGGSSAPRTEAVVAVDAVEGRRLGAADGSSLAVVADAYARCLDRPHELRNLVLVHVIGSCGPSSHVRVRTGNGSDEVVVAEHGTDPIATTVAALVRATTPRR